MRRFLATFLTALCLLCVHPADAYVLKQSSTQRPLLFQMVLASDGTTPATGLSPTVTISKNGGAFAAPSGAVSEVGNGWYEAAANATDTGTLGVLLLHATAATAAVTDQIYEVVAYDPQDSVRIGLSALPNATAGASGGLPIGDGSGRVQLQPTQTGVTIPTVTTVGSVSGSVGSVTGSVGSISNVSFPANFALIVIDGSGKVALQAAEHTAIATDAATGVLSATVDGTLTLKQIQALAVSILGNKYARTWNSGTHTAVITYYRADNSTLLAVQTVIYDSSNVQVLSRTTVFSNLP